MSWKSWNLRIAIKITLLGVFLNDLCQRNVDSGWQFIAMIITVKMTLYHPLIIPLPIPTKKKKQTKPNRAKQNDRKKRKQAKMLGSNFIKWNWVTLPCQWLHLCYKYFTRNLLYHAVQGVESDTLNVAKTESLNGDLNEILFDIRSLWVGACNSPIFLSRRFHRPIYFYIESTLNETPVGVP